MRNIERVYTEPVGCYVSKEMKERIENLSITKGKTISLILRELLEKALKEEEID